MEKKAIGPLMKIQMQKGFSQQKMTSSGHWMKKQISGMQRISLAGPIEEEKVKEKAKRARENTSRRGEAISDRTGGVAKHI